MKKLKLLVDVVRAMRGSDEHYLGEDGRRDLALPYATEPRSGRLTAMSSPGGHRVSSVNRAWETARRGRIAGVTGQPQTRHTEGAHPAGQ
jgi:hypothetical protein